MQMLHTPLFLQMRELPGRAAPPCHPEAQPKDLVQWGPSRVGTLEARDPSLLAQDDRREFCGWALPQGGELLTHRFVV